MALTETMRMLLSIYLALTYSLMYFLGGVFCVVCSIQGTFAESQELQDTYFMAGFGFLGFHLFSFYFAAKLKILVNDEKPIDKTD